MLSIPSIFFTRQFTLCNRLNLYFAHTLCFSFFFTSQLSFLLLIFRFSAQYISFVFHLLSFSQHHSCIAAPRHRHFDIISHTFLFISPPVSSFLFMTIHCVISSSSSATYTLHTVLTCYFPPFFFSPVTLKLILVRRTSHSALSMLVPFFIIFPLQPCPIV